MDEIAELRKQIDALDSELVSVLARRFQVTDKVGKIKAEQELPAKDAEREQSQKEKIRILAAEMGLEPEVAVNVLNSIIKEVVMRHQQTKAAQQDRF